MRVSEVVASEKARWNAFVRTSAARSFLQTWEWGDVQEALSNPIWRIVVESERGHILACALVLERSVRLGYSWLYIPRGPIFLDTLTDAEKSQAWEVLEAKLTSLAQERDAFFVRIDPAVSHLSRSGWRKSSREVQPRNTLLLDLATPEDELFSRIHSKTRYNIRTAQRKGVMVRFSTDANDVEKFLAASHSVTHRTGFSYHPDEYYRQSLAVLSRSDMAELAIAEIDGNLAAVHFMVYADGIATYAHGASLYEKREYMAPALLYWETILRAKGKGMHTYDFFGIAPEGADENHPWAGVTRMKMAFGGTRVAYAGAYDFVLHEGLYAMFNVTRRARLLLKNTTI